MSATGSVDGFSQRHGVGVGFARWAARLLPAGWILLRRNDRPDEAVLATLGPVQIRRTHAGVVARTVVKGEADAALQTGLRRLMDYASGYNRVALPVSAARPLVQRPCAPGRWLMQISLPGMYTQFAAPVPCSSKTRILAQPTETFATLRLSGRPCSSALVRAEAQILALLAGSGWIASGTASFRLYAPPGFFPWTGQFEIAVPVKAA